MAYRVDGGSVLFVRVLSKQKAAQAAHANSRLAVHVKDEPALTKYEFGSETAEFYVWAECGVTPVALSEIDTQKVVNVRTINDLSSVTVSEASTELDAEDIAGRLSRKAQNWIPDVERQR